MAKEIKLQLVTEKQACEMLSVSETMLRKMRACPGPDPLPFFKIGKCVRYSLKDIADWLERRRAYDSHEASRLAFAV
jgi:hypothetical protein